MSSPYGRMALICNSGRRSVAKVLPAVEAELTRRGLEHEIRSTAAPGQAAGLARAALEEGLRLVVAVGGDGTVHEVVNGMIVADRSVSADGLLGVLPAGRGSDFVKTFGLPADPVVAVRNLEGEEAFSIDVGKVTFVGAAGEEVRYFANIAEAGIGADVVARADRLPRWLGPTVYMVAFWLTLRSFEPSDAEVDLVDRTYEGKVNNVVIANGQFFGGGMKIAPRAAPTDGLLDILIDRTSKKEAVALLPKIFKGEHLPHPDIEMAKRVRCSLRAEPSMLVEADGEVLGRTPARFEVLRDAIRLKV